MKSLFFSLLIAGALSISLVSCKKEGALTESATQTPPPPPPPPQPFRINLVADSWIKYSWITCDPRTAHHGECPNNGHTTNYTMYVCSLPNVLSAANVNCNCTIKVYLASNGNDIQINDSPIMFMGNELVAAVMQSGIEINYKSNALTLPFSSLNIRVVGE